MKRSIEKYIAKGKHIVAGHERQCMTISEIDYFINELQAENKTGIIDTIYNAFLMGVAVGDRIRTRDRERAEAGKKEKAGD